MRFEPWQFIANTVQRGMIMEWVSPESPVFWEVGRLPLHSWNGTAFKDRPLRFGLGLNQQAPK
jgi:hypothetical protein